MPGRLLSGTRLWSGSGFSAENPRIPRRELSGKGRQNSAATRSAQRTQPLPPGGKAGTVEAHSSQPSSLLKGVMSRVLDFLTGNPLWLTSSQPKSPSGEDLTGARLVSLRLPQRRSAVTFRPRLAHPDADFQSAWGRRSNRRFAAAPPAGLRKGSCRAKGNITRRQRASLNEVRVSP